MKTPRTIALEARISAIRGFTMVEIAIALAVIAFALVAIIGVLPSGLQVQRESREKTIINEDARYFLDAIKTGAHDLQDLTNFVRAVSVGNYQYSNFTSGWEIIGLLSTRTPIDQQTGRRVPNQAIVRAVTGSAVERSSDTLDFAFQYGMLVEINSALPTVNPNHPSRAALGTKLWDVRLEFRWPWLPSGQMGKNRAVYRSLVSGHLVNDPTNSVYWFFRP